ncbi:AlpA family phage regulatory protein [Pseudomonas sp. 91RF]|jgi:prophage regulatory protein|uniref:AlpA family transcriptional regulator n=1 Tax=Pseudomonas sp. 91RF TaxID=2292261 RepID=UPI000E668395|nr:AlpA family transcriptional regulator [Pseudomonas sp. 91RF]RIJ09698.1 AlpA family phage regulatory protein [Pseudomonas sp. 91RF]
MESQVEQLCALPERRILRRREVEQKTGLKRAFIYVLMNQGRFPRSLRLGARAVGWDAMEVDQWIADRLKERG